MLAGARDQPFFAPKDDREPEEAAASVARRYINRLPHGERLRFRMTRHGRTLTKEELGSLNHSPEADLNARLLLAHSREVRFTEQSRHEPAGKTGWISRK